jgi:molecular chaperone DnaK (HSP70)
VSDARYIIGIDLGTTNTAVAYVDTRSAEQRVQIFDVPQLTAPGETAPRRQLPSFIYLASEHDLTPAETALPWDDRRRMVVGELARSQGARVASRMISSSKSWLCHGGVDRHAPILPWGSEEGLKLSPVGASAMVLRHIQEAWDHLHEDQDDAEFFDQEIMVTVPASFDEAARELTHDASTTAGYESLVLLEEPQAAFYAWIDSHPAGARKKVLNPGDRVLVFDVGGGTTDFTLISVGTDGETFERTAVGDHLLLGGDNIDLTLAKQVEARLSKERKKKLDSLQWHGLVHSCRLAKETLFADSSKHEIPITVAGRGSKLIGGTLKDAVQREELERTVLEGFFPGVERGAAPVKARGGLQEFGLPYAADPAITRHLASFLDRHHVDKVDAVLFNGGAMTPPSLRARVLEQIAKWQGSVPQELSNELPELAVAKGAAYYGLVRRGLGARIRGGTPRSFYVGVGLVQDQEMAVCLAGKGLEEGSSVELNRDFELVTNRPVSFKLFSSTTRDDSPGDLVPVGDGLADMSDDGSDLLELPPIVSVVRAPGRSRVTVHLEVRITELGALEIFCRAQQAKEDGEHERWRLSFDMRGGGAGKEEQDDAEIDPRLPGAKELLKNAFSGVGEIKVAGLMKALEKALEARRDEWNMTTTRGLFDAALEVEEMRKKSADHEARWLNLCGFCLRPGNGAPLDQWRVKQMWRIFNENLCFPKHEQCRLAWWIVWRRIAGGLTKGQQEQIFDRLGQLFLPSKLQKKKWHKAKPTKQEAAEMWRTLANLERLSIESKIALGDELTRRMESKKGLQESLHFWALGRIGARIPLYGPLNSVVPAKHANRWLEQLLGAEWPAPDKAAFPMAQLGRRTGDRSRDVDDGVREKLSGRLRKAPGGERTARLVEQVVALEAREERVALGDTLPAGLRLVSDS